MTTESGFRLRVLLVLSCLLASCADADRAATEGLAAEAPAAGGRLFTQLPSTYTGVRFENRLADTRDVNVFTYRNYYNGGGVALGDLTGDGSLDLVLGNFNPEVPFLPNRAGPGGFEFAIDRHGGLRPPGLQGHRQNERTFPVLP